MGPAVADEADPGLESPATGRTEVCCLYFKSYDHLLVESV